MDEHGLFQVKKILCVSVYSYDFYGFLWYIYTLADAQTANSLLTAQWSSTVGQWQRCRSGWICDCTVALKSTDSCFKNHLKAKEFSVVFQNRSCKLRRVRANLYFTSCLLTRLGLRRFGRVKSVGLPLCLWFFHGHRGHLLWDSPSVFSDTARDELFGSLCLCGGHLT